MKRPFPLLLYFNILSVPVSSFVVPIENVTRGGFDGFLTRCGRLVDRENDIADPQIGEYPRDSFCCESVGGVVFWVFLNVLVSFDRRLRHFEC